MRKLLLAVAVQTLFSGCAIFRIFRGKEKSGCPVGRNVGAEKILSGDAASIKAARKAGDKKADKGLLQYKYGQ